MKRLFLIAAAVSFVCGTVMAQEAKFDEAAIIKKIDKLELNTQNPKKSTKAETWLALGDAYTEAGTIASTGLYRGMDEFTTKILMQNPEEGTETINGVEYVKYSNAYLDVYLKDMMVQFWRVKRNFVDGALEKGVAAYQKAYELDPKNAEAKVKTGLEKIAKATLTKNAYSAKAAIIVYADVNDCWIRSFDSHCIYEIDASIVTTYMMMEATEQGLGSLWVARFDPKILKEEFHAPESYIPVAILCLGYAEPQAVKSSERYKTERKPLSETVWYESF